MKTCGKCKEAKPFEAFGKNGKHLQSYCKPCKVEWDKEYYAKNQRRRDSVRETNKRITSRNRDIIWKYLLDNPCVDCGEADPIVLEFDHQGDKVLGVGILATKMVSVETLMSEIEKCEVRCCNCHRRRTAKVGGWWTDERGGSSTVRAFG